MFKRPLNKADMIFAIVSTSLVALTIKQISAQLPVLYPGVNVSEKYIWSILGNVRKTYYIYEWVRGSAVKRRARARGPWAAAYRHSKLGRMENAPRPKKGRT